MKHRLRHPSPATVLGLLFVASFLVLADIHVGGDGMSYYAYIRSAIIDGDFNFYNEDGNYNLYRQVMCPYNARTHAGYVHNQFAIGPAILWLPFFVVGHLWAGLSGLPQDGYTFPYVFAVTLGTVFYSSLGLFFSYRLARTFASRTAALWASVAFWLGSAVTFYTFKDATYAHALSFFAISLLLYAWNRGRDNISNGHFLAMGTLVGLAALIRWQNALFIVLPAIDLLVKAWQGVNNKDWRGTWHVFGRGVLLGIGTLVAFTPQLLIWQVLYQRWILVPQGGGFLGWFHPHWLQVLFSAYHGLFVYTPLAVLGVVGLLISLRRTDLLVAMAFVAAFGLQIYVSSTVADWWAGYSFGMRRLVNCTPLLIVGLSVLLDQPGTRMYRCLLQPLLILLVAWNLLLVVEVGQRSLLDPEDRTLGFYLTALRHTPAFIAEPLKLWKLGFSYLPTAVYGVFKRDPVVFQSVLFLLVAGGALCWLISATEHPGIARATLILFVALVVVVDGFIAFSAWDSRELYALDPATSPSPLLYTRIRQERVYEGLLVQRGFDISPDSLTQEVAVSNPQLSNGLEMLWSWYNMANGSTAVLQIVVTAMEGEEERFVLESNESSQLPVAQMQRWLDPFGTPMFIPYWLIPERFVLRQIPIYRASFRFRHPMTPVRVRFRTVSGGGNWQVHSLALIPDHRD